MLEIFDKDANISLMLIHIYKMYFIINKKCILENINLDVNYVIDSIFLGICVVKDA